MTATELTAIVTALTAVVTSVVVPLYLRRQAAKQATARGEIVTFQSITTVLQQERDDLRTELRTVEDTYRARIRAVADDYDKQLIAAKARITQLETEVAELYRRLYARDAPPPLSPPP